MRFNSEPAFRSDVAFSLDGQTQCKLHFSVSLWRPHSAQKFSNALRPWQFKTLTKYMARPECRVMTGMPRVNVEQRVRCAGWRIVEQGTRPARPAVSGEPRLVLYRRRVASLDKHTGCFPTMDLARNICHSWRRNVGFRFPFPLRSPVGVATLGFGAENEKGFSLFSVGCTRGYTSSSNQR